MPNGAMLANSGHFDAEIDLVALSEMSGGRVRQLRRDVKEYDLGDRKLYVIADGRLVNLAAAEGHPAAVMDMSFANQALAAEYGAKNHASLGPQVHIMPAEIDREVARLKLEALGVEIDTMTPEQVKYTNSWDAGT
jgi:adenosylhomocysteinase